NLFAPAEHAEAAAEVFVGVEPFGRVEGAARVGDVGDATGVEVADLSGLVVVADGVPLAEVVVQEEHVNVALGVGGAVLRVVAHVQRPAVRCRRGEPTQDGGRGV